jgi:23S rRNA (guanosine2251-2'-O)-methyltransferase
MNLICGVNPVLEALAAGTRHFDRLLIVKGLRGRRLAEAMRRATRLGIPLRFEMRETLDRMAGGIQHQGIVAIVSEKPVLSLESLLAAARQPALLVVLDGVEDPRNLGAILRTAEAAGADGVLVPERHSAGLNETVARASAGALEHVRVARVGNLVQAIQALKEQGIWVVGYDASGTERWDAVDLTRPVALVLGGEGRGMRRLVREHCDHLVSIPHFGHVSSLNVSVAAGVALYEAVRQRKAVPSVVRPIPQRAEGPSHVVGPAADDEEDTGFDAAPREWFEDEPGGDEHDLTTPAIPHIDFHEDVAWGRGPTVLKAIDFHRAHRPGDRRDRRGKLGKRRKAGAAPRGDDGTRSRPPEPRPEQRGESTPPAAAGEAAEQGRKRSRRRRRRPRPEAQSSPPSGGEPRREGGAPGAEPAPSASARAGGEGQAARRRRRRRR